MSSAVYKTLHYTQVYPHVHTGLGLRSQKCSQSAIYGLSLFCCNDFVQIFSSFFFVLFFKINVVHRNVDNFVNFVKKTSVEIYTIQVNTDFLGKNNISVKTGQF